MLPRNVFACAVLVASLLALPVNAQRILLLPGQGSTARVFANDGLTALTPINAQSGAFAILAKPDGTRYFVVSSANVSIADAGGNETQPPVQVGLPIAAAEITPDGRKILLAAGAASNGVLYVFDISSGTMEELAAVSIGNNPTALAVSLDSRYAFVVTASGLSKVSLESSTVTQTVQLAGMDERMSKVVAGPNGFLYVTAEGALHEVNPRTMESTPIPVTPAFPSKPTFTPDGTRVMVSGLGARTGQPALMIISLATRAIIHRLNAFSNVMFDYMLWGGPDKVYAYSSSHRKLYQLTNTLGGIEEAVIPGVGSIPTVHAAFNSTEVPNGQGIVGPKYLFVVGQDALYRIDLDPHESTPPAQTVTSVPLPLPPSPGGIFFTPPSTAATTIAHRIVYGDKQNVAKGKESKPLVLRIVDQFGNPIMGVPVTFTPTAGEIVEPMTETNSGGYAQAIVKAPQIDGEFAVRAALGTGPSVDFLLNTGSSGGGETPGQDPGPGASGISIVSGNGQVMHGGALSLEPIVLSVTDAGGSPLPNTTVRFTMGGAAGGTIVGSTCAGVSGGIACTTDSNGRVSVNFRAPSVLYQSDSWKQTTITATVPGLSGVASPSVTVYATAVPAETAVGTGPMQFPKLVQPGQPGATLSVQAGQTLNGAITVLTYAQSGPFTGQPMPNVGLHVRATLQYNPEVPSPAYCLGGTVLSGADGTATCNLHVPIDTQPGSYEIYAISGGNTGLRFILEVAEAPPPVPVPTTVTVVSGNNQSGTPGQTLAPLVAVVRDQFGQPMANVDVQWSVVSGSATLSSPATKTAANGQASTGVVLGATVGPVVVRMAAGNATPALFNLTVTVAIGNLTKASGDGQTVIVGQQFQPVAVKVTDSGGNPIPGVAVSFAVTSGQATPMSQTAVSDAAGIAAATFTATNNPGQIVIQASAGSATQQFQLAAREPGPLLTAGSFLNGASMQPGISFGSIAAIRGEGLTTGLSIPPGACLTGAADGNIQRELPTQLAGIEVVFEYFHPAPILAICKTPDGGDQINVQVPFGLAPGTNLRADVRTGIGTSSEMTVTVTDLEITNALPGIFEYQASASARAAVALRPDGTVVSPTNPAKRGEEVRLYTTGLGPVLPVNGVEVKTNQPGYPGQKPFFATSVQLGGAGVAGVTAEYAQNLIGVFIVTFQVPPDAPVGDAVPVVVTVVKDTGETVESLPSSIPIVE